MELINKAFYMQPLFNYVNITAATTTSIPCQALRGITINTPAAGTITIYDNPIAASGNKVATIAASATGSFVYEVSLKNGGVTIVTAATTDLTVGYR